VCSKCVPTGPGRVSFRSIGLSSARDRVLGHSKHLALCYPARVAGRVAIVSFDHRGNEWYCVTAGRTLFEAVRNAARFFAAPYWRGPKPKADAIFKVTLVGDERRWLVRGGSTRNLRLPE
jgi:hypothetical protein